MTPRNDHEKVLLDEMAERWSYPPFPLSDDDALQLLEFQLLENGVARLHDALHRKERDRILDWIAAGVWFLELHANDTGGAS